MQSVHSAGLDLSRKQSPPEPKLGYFENQSQEPLPSNSIPGTYLSFREIVSPFMKLE